MTWKENDMFWYDLFINQIIYLLVYQLYGCRYYIGNFHAAYENMNQLGWRTSDGYIMLCIQQRYWSSTYFSFEKFCVSNVNLFQLPLCRRDYYLWSIDIVSKLFDFLLVRTDYV